MRLVQHEDGWIYGLFCTERRDPYPRQRMINPQRLRNVESSEQRIYEMWQRLPDLKTHSPQQRNVVLHPEFVNGKYAFYTRPQDGFIKAGNGGGIGFGLSNSIENAVIEEEIVIDAKVYHTVYEAKNGLGPAPIKTKHGWLHLAHGVRNTAAGLRYVLYMFMTDLNDLTKVIYKPAGYFMAPEGEERIGDVSNVLFSNGWIVDDDGLCLFTMHLLIPGLHVATSTVDQLLDYVMNTPSDGFSSAETVKTLTQIIENNQSELMLNTILSSTENKKAK